MTAVGILSLLLGIIIANILGEVRAHKFNNWDYLAGVLIFFGAGAIAVGTILFAWKYLP